MDWSDFMFDFEYSICTEPDKDIFLKQCKALEKYIPNLQKANLLKDVDDSETQVYYLNNKKILVHNSYYTGAVYIESEFDIEKYFQS